MVFSSTLFLFIFLPILLILYFFINPKFQNALLLLASLFFYAWGEPRVVFLMLLSIVVNYLFGLALDRFSKKKIVLCISVIYNLGMLFVFKYLDFSLSIVNELFKANLPLQEIALPIGISFYTFQIMSYVIDVYRGKASVQKNILNLALYISLFPQLIAGPIVRYVDIEKQIISRETSLERMYEGLYRFSIGFSKKVLIADQMASLVDLTFAADYSSLYGHWIGIIAYTLQIYFDFSGYSDMAIGLGKIFGFDFLENFNYPYISQSIQEFWRRWHISLSSWFRDYVYIPLGGSRQGELRTYANLVIVFFLTGLWHGASFNFIVWGLYYAVFLVIERLGFKHVLEKLPKPIRHAYAVFVILIGWVFFRADSLTSAVVYIKNLFVPAGMDMEYFLYIMTPEYWTFLIAGIVLSVPHTKLVAKVRTLKYGNVVLDILVIVSFLLAICYLVGAGYSPFLYFRF